MLVKNIIFLPLLLLSTLSIQIKKKRVYHLLEILSFFPVKLLLTCLFISVLRVSIRILKRVSCVSKSQPKYLTENEHFKKN